MRDAYLVNYFTSWWKGKICLLYGVKLDSFGFYASAANHYNTLLGAAKCIQEQITASDANVDKTLKQDINKLPNHLPELQRFEHTAFQR